MRLIPIGLAFVICGCAVAEKIQSHDDMMQAKAAYIGCLQQNIAEPSACNGYKQIYEVDLRADRDKPNPFSTLADRMQQSNPNAVNLYIHQDGTR